MVYCLQPLTRVAVCVCACVCVCVSLCCCLGLPWLWEKIRDSELCLTGTAEIPLAALHADVIMSRDRLPSRYAAFGHAFRTEVGARGKATKGLYRLHQFSKVEMFAFCRPEDSEALHERLCDTQIEMFAELGLHFR